MREASERYAELVLKGVGDVPAHVMLAVADEVRKAVARLNVADVRIRVSTRDEREPSLLPGA
jgi:hypothetical protein